MQEDNKVRNVELAYLGLCLKGVQPKLEIASNRRIKGLGSIQSRKLIEYFQK